MATVEQRNKRFRLIFYFAGQRYSGALRTAERREAEAIAGSVNRTLMLLEQGLLEVPEGADLVSFVLSSGKLAEKPKAPTIRTLAELRDRYLQAHAIGAMEQNSLDTVKMHLRHVVKTLGADFAIQALDLTHLQEHIERRAKQRSNLKRRLSPVTLRKELASFRACWNWGVQARLVTGRFPNKGVKYPKTDEKPPFQTWETIHRQIERGGLTATEQRDLWNCLFLTIPQTNELQEFIKETARHPFIYPMFCFAAHTGARRSEMLRLRIDDLDFGAGTVILHEKKRVRGKRTSRLVPLSAPLVSVLKDWLTVHPGGQFVLCHQLAVHRSKKKRQVCSALTRDEANDHFKRALTGSKWDKLRGWHVFRHSFASNCAAKGIDQRIIDEWMGHQTEEMRRRYRHLFPDQQRAAIQLVFGGTKTGPQEPQPGN